MYFLDRVRDRNGADIYKTKAGFRDSPTVKGQKNPQLIAFYGLLSFHQNSFQEKSGLFLQEEKARIILVWWS